MRGGNLVDAGGGQPASGASMRPPHCAGEIADDDLAWRSRFRASMRPPHCAGEIPRQPDRQAVGLIASMRPPHCAGEIVRVRLDAQRGADLASMRPPHCAGEIAAARRGARTTSARFNEAPALRGGNRRRPRGAPPSGQSFNEAPALRGGNHPLQRQRLAPRLRASMRPPHCAGEIVLNQLSRSRYVLGFNEAPALRGGNRSATASMHSTCTLLQ